jgi:hypothetical protein
VCPDRLLDTTTNNIAIKPKYKLSSTDMRWLEIMYPKDGKRDLTLIGAIGGDVTDDIDAPDWLDANAAEEWFAKVQTFFKQYRTVAILGAVLLGLFIVYWNFFR